MKLIEWLIPWERGEFEVDDNATVEEIEKCITEEISKFEFYEWKEKTQYCGNCKYYDEFEGVCTNGYSDYIADCTDFDFVCEEWKEQSYATNDSNSKP